MYICAMRENEQIQDTYEYSNGELAAQLGDRFRNYRNSLGLSQKEIALNSGVSVMTIVRFEKGQSSSIRLDNLIALFRAIQRLDDIMELVPDMPESLYTKKSRK